LIKCPIIAEIIRNQESVRKFYAMKKLAFTLACLFSGSLVFSQKEFSFGAKAGATLGNFVTDDPRWSWKAVPGYMIGGYGTLMLTRHVGFQADVLFNHVVFATYRSYGSNFAPNTYFNIRSNNLSIPVMAHFRFNQITLDAGLQINALLSASYRNSGIETYGVKNGVSGYYKTSSLDEKDASNYFTAINPGFLVGLGVQLPCGITAGARFTMSRTGMTNEDLTHTYLSLVSHAYVGYAFVKNVPK
jgi:Outer membrane protein beta-barrel domain